MTVKANERAKGDFIRFRDPRANVSFSHGESTPLKNYARRNRCSVRIIHTERNCSERSLWRVTGGMGDEVAEMENDVAIAIGN